MSSAHGYPRWQTAPPTSPHVEAQKAARDRRAPRDPSPRPGEGTYRPEPGDERRRPPEAGAGQQLSGQSAQPGRRAEHRHPQVGGLPRLLVGHVRR